METAATAQSAKFEQWCIVELFGHTRIAGLVTEATIGGCAFIRVDVPKFDVPDETLFTRYLGNGAIYALNPTTKEDVLRACEYLSPRPPVPRVSEDRALPEFNPRDYAEDEDDDELDS